MKSTIGIASAIVLCLASFGIAADVKLDSDCTAYCATVMALPQMREWVDAAKAEPDEVVELDVEF